MLQVITRSKDLVGNKIPNNGTVKEYTITQGDTFTLFITDENNAIQGARFILGTEAYSELYTRNFAIDQVSGKWACLIPSVDTNQWAVTLTDEDSNPYIYEIEATLNDGNKISVAKYYFNVTNQVGEI